MSHACYSFLVSSTRTRDAIKTFDAWAEDNTDENNWSSPIKFTSAKGRMTYLTKDDGDDARSAHAQASDLVDAWSKAWRLAMLCVYDSIMTSVNGLQRQRTFVKKTSTEFRYPSVDSRRRHQWIDAHINTLSVDQLHERIHRRGVMVLTSAMRMQPTQSKRHDLNMVEYYIHTAMRSYMFYRDSLRKGHAPFSSDSSATPYTYRAFNLIVDEDQEPGGILLMDIHT